MQTYSDVVTQVAIKAIYAIDNKLHGIYGVDMTYDSITFQIQQKCASFYYTYYFASRFKYAQV